MNRARDIDSQDCHYIGGSKMLCSGLNNYRSSPDAAVFRRGGIGIVDLNCNQAMWQGPVELWSPTPGLPMAQNPVCIEPITNGIRTYFMPDDDKSTLYVYEAVTKKRGKACAACANPAYKQAIAASGANGTRSTAN